MAGNISDSRRFEAWFAFASEQCPVSLFVCGGEGPAPRPRFAYPFLPTPAPPSAGIGHAPDPNPRHEPANPVSLS